MDKKNKVAEKLKSWTSGHRPRMFIAFLAAAIFYLA